MDYKRRPENVKRSKERKQWSRKKRLTRTYNNEARFLLELLGSKNALAS